jgi:uncharacterized protein involved in tolerance to divalent cations
MVSLYWWQGATERGEEVVMIIKTRAALAEGVRTAADRTGRSGLQRLDHGRNQSAP